MLEILVIAKEEMRHHRYGLAQRCNGVKTCT